MKEIKYTAYAAGNDVKGYIFVEDDSSDEEIEQKIMDDIVESIDFEECDS